MKKLLDLTCADYGFKTISELQKDCRLDKSKIENHLRKSIGILEEDGIFAFFVYQVDKEKDGGTQITCKMVDMLKEFNIFRDIDCSEDTLSNLNKIREFLACEDSLDKLALIKKIVGRALTYALFHAKALQEKPKKEGKS